VAAVVVAILQLIVTAIVIMADIVLTLAKKLNPPQSFHTPNSSYSLVPSPPICHQQLIVFVADVIVAAIQLIVTAIVVVVVVILSPSQKYSSSWSFS
jgi:hypothetical protein